MVFVPFIIALLLALLFIPLVRRVSIRLGQVARPREDRWHRNPTATLGGVGIFLAFILSLIISEIILGEGNQIRWGLLAGSILVFLLGLYDDFRHISPPAKLVGQILAAAVIVFQGYVTGFFTPRIPDNIIAQIPNILVTFIWLVGITNAINLLDNMDGLAGGISLVTAGILSFFFWRVGNLSLLWVSLALAGSTLGFLVYNFPPASIFMGDSGSLFLGFTLAVLAIARQPQASNVFAVMAVPTLLFLLPILDTSLVTFTRILRGQSPTQGGRDHTSHRLIAFGMTERQAVLTLYMAALASGVTAALLESIKYWYSLVLVPILVISLALLTAYLGRLKVVESSSAEKGKAITRIMLELTLKRRLLEVVLDFFLICLAFYLAFLTRYGFNMDTQSLQLYLRALPVALAGTYISSYIFGIYRGVWRYVGVDDLVRLAEAAGGSGILVAAAVLVIYPASGYLPMLFLLYAIFLFLGYTASRSSFKILDLISGNQTRGAEERVLIYGAGDAGEMALRWIMMNPQLDYRPIGFLDDDPFMTGRQIHGIEVLGGPEQLDTILEKKQVNGLILAKKDTLFLPPLSNGNATNDVVEKCREQGCWVRSLRLEFEVLE